MIPLCLTLGNIRYVSRVKWSNPGKAVAPSATPQCSSYWKREHSGDVALMWVCATLSHSLIFFFFYAGFPSSFLPKTMKKGCHHENGWTTLIILIICLERESTCLIFLFLDEKHMLRRGNFLCIKFYMYIFLGKNICLLARLSDDVFQITDHNVLPFCFQSLLFFMLA